jgi:TonB family protein
MVLTKFRMTERQVMALIMVACFIAFGGAFLYVGMHKREEPAEFGKPPVVRWMPQQTGPTADSIEYVIADLLDPSLMSLPNRHGFSLALWQRQAPPGSPEMAVDTGPSFLGLSHSTNVVSLLAQPALTDEVQASVEKAAGVAEEPADPEEAGLAKQLEHSVIDFAGPLEERAVVTAPEPPVIASDAPLRPTRVRIAVAAEGTVRYAVLDSSCGAEAVDAQAVELAQRIRFEPEAGFDPVGLAWGTVRFLWATAPSAVQTNETRAARP